MITIDYLKELFVEKYGISLLVEKDLPQVIVILTKDQYNELNNDLMSMTGHGILLLVDESDMTFMNPEDILYTKIRVPHFCEFLIQLGDEFEFKMEDENFEHGEDEL